MSDIVIKAEDIGKSYLIGHKYNERYVALRDVIANKAKELLSKIRSPQKHTSTNIEEFWALKDVSFEVRKGDRIGIIGRNGAGKSTLLKILSRITEPTTGRVTIKGRVASLLEVGTGFHPELTGRENIYLNGAILGMTRKEIKAKFDEIVDFAEVEKFLDTPVKHFSSGMYVRLAFAVAAHLEPEILVVDEVLAVGDTQFQKKCLGKMSEVAIEGRTVLFVSHNMAAVQQLCSKGIVLSCGQLSYSGTAHNAVEQYLNMSNISVMYGEDGFVDLEKVREKVYNAKIFKRIRMLDKNNFPCQTFPMLGSLKIEVELENAEKYPDADYCIAFLTPFGQWITSSATWMYPKGHNNESKKRILLEIPSLRYSPGVYKVYLSMTQHSAGVYIDRIENAATFYIEPVDIFNSGKEFTSECGFVLPDGGIKVL